MFGNKLYYEKQYSRYSVWYYADGCTHYLRLSTLREIKTVARKFGFRPLEVKSN